MAHSKKLEKRLEKGTASLHYYLSELLLIKEDASRKTEDDIRKEPSSINLFWLGSPIPELYKLAILNCSKLNSKLYNIRLWHDSRYLTEEEGREIHQFCDDNNIEILDVKDHEFWHDFETSGDHFEKKDVMKIVQRVDRLRLDEKILANGIYIDCDAAGKLKAPFPCLEHIRQEMQATGNLCMFNLEYHHGTPYQQKIKKHHHHPGISNSIIATPFPEAPFINFLKESILRGTKFIDLAVRPRIDADRKRAEVEHSTGPDYIMMCLYNFIDPKSHPARSIHEIRERVRKLESTIFNMTSITKKIFHISEQSFLSGSKATIGDLATHMAWTPKGQKTLLSISNKVKAQREKSKTFDITSENEFPPLVSYKAAGL
jgi:hypothetical protein